LDVARLCVREVGWHRYRKVIFSGIRLEKSLAGLTTFAATLVVRVAIIKQSIATTVITLDIYKNRKL